MQQTAEEDRTECVPKDTHRTCVEIWSQRYGYEDKAPELLKALDDHGLKCCEIIRTAPILTIRQIMTGCKLRVGHMNALRIVVFGSDGGDWEPTPEAEVGPQKIETVKKERGGRRIPVGEELANRIVTQEDMDNYQLSTDFDRFPAVIADARPVVVQAVQEVIATLRSNILTRASVHPHPPTPLPHLQVRAWAGDLYATNAEVKVVSDALHKRFGPLGDYANKPRTWNTYLHTCVRKARGSPNSFGLPDNKATTDTVAPMRKHCARTPAPASMPQPFEVSEDYTPPRMVAEEVDVAEGEEELSEVKKEPPQVDLSARKTYIDLDADNTQHGEVEGGAGQKKHVAKMTIEPLADNAQRVLHIGAGGGLALGARPSFGARAGCQFSTPHIQFAEMPKPVGILGVDGAPSGSKKKAAAEKKAETAAVKASAAEERAAAKVAKETEKKTMEAEKAKEREAREAERSAEKAAREAAKVQQEAQKAADRQVKEAEKAEKKKAQEAEKEAKKQALEAEKEAKKQALEAEKEAKKQAVAAEKEAKADAKAREEAAKRMAEQEANAAREQAEKEAEEVAKKKEPERAEKKKEGESLKRTHAQCQADKVRCSTCNCEQSMDEIEINRKLYVCIDKEACSSRLINVGKRIRHSGSTRCHH